MGFVCCVVIHLNFLKHLMDSTCTNDRLIAKIKEFLVKGGIYLCAKYLFFLS